MNFYSQRGEDKYVYEILKDIKNGFFIDVGALEGKHLSNTLVFELNGWSGICIEPHNYFYNILKTNRLNSKCLNFAISDFDKDDCDFAINYYGTCSTLHPEKYKKSFQRLLKSVFRGFENQKTNIRKLSTIINENNIKNIDLLSTDTEGNDYKVLKGLDLSVNRPRVMIVECLQCAEDNESKIKQLMLDYQYHIGCMLDNNLIAFRDKEDFEKSKNINISKLRKDLIHTGYPR
jgi:FkbM family methyltransferase